MPRPCDKVGHGSWKRVSPGVALALGTPFQAWICPGPIVPGQTYLQDVPPRRERIRGRQVWQDACPTSSGPWLLSHGIVSSVTEGVPAEQAPRDTPARTASILGLQSQHLQSPGASLHPEIVNHLPGPKTQGPVDLRKEPFTSARKRDHPLGRTVGPEGRNLRPSVGKKLTVASTLFLTSI